MREDQKNFRIFTDGACLGNPGPGGYGAIILTPDDHIHELGARDADTTNNRMEMQAILESLKWVAAANDVAGSTITCLSDSAYALNGIKEWRFGWRQRGWRKASGEEVANRDIWQALDALIDEMSKQNICFIWRHVAGHAGIPGNERVDQIASSYAQSAPPELYQGPYEGYGIDLSNESPAPESAAAKGKGKNQLKAKSGQKASGSKQSSKKPLGYVSYLDGDFRFHKTWGECQSRVTGRPAKFRKVFSQEEARELERQWRRG